MIFESQTYWAVWISNKRLNTPIDRHWFRHGALNGPGGQTFTLDCANSSVLKKQMETTSKCGWTTWFELNGKRCSFFFFHCRESCHYCKPVQNQFVFSKCTMQMWFHYICTHVRHFVVSIWKKKTPTNSCFLFFSLEIFIKTKSISILNSTLTVGKVFRVCAC